VPDEAYIKHLDTRVSKLEAHVASIGTEVTSIKESQKLIVSKLDNITNYQARSGKVSWPLVVSVGTLLVSILGGLITYSYLILNPIKENIGRIDEIQSRMLTEMMESRRDLDIVLAQSKDLKTEFKSHQSLSNHPHYQTYRIEAIEEQLNRLDKKNHQH
jgi:hypothetical protein